MRVPLLLAAILLVQGCAFGQRVGVPQIAVGQSKPVVIYANAAARVRGGTSTLCTLMLNFEIARKPAEKIHFYLNATNSFLLAFDAEQKDLADPVILGGLQIRYSSNLEDAESLIGEKQQELASRAPLPPGQTRPPALTLEEARALLPESLIRACEKLKEPIAIEELEGEKSWVDDVLDFFTWPFEAFV